MQPDIQPTLENDQVILQPLREHDFDELYAVASDPKVWEQHPNRDRWKKEVFQNFFEGALESGGAFKIVDKTTGHVIGSTRYYDYDDSARSIYIGYTFYGTMYWGKGINSQVKKLMLNYIFQFVERVLFQVGAENVRSQIAVERIGGIRTGELDVAYYGEPPRRNYLYEIRRPQ
ncbi:GNAT family N-acetyltransferase [Dyadobacter sandarakinus]|uniref:GNAT family N-acetyltransferase n=1 Tax=Dyadobacter sandarakinus TaxID=2747268 RepID=A0ABX7I2K5_9BACT|nr:GNAT family N-acetyltransferase [Dyadobacter sandarakinus]QRR00105.1 GNAT family N-acetyltransferase [Dyadobacter sandarakinus]